MNSRFHVPGLWIRPEVLGQIHSWTVGGHRVVLALPKSSDDLMPDDEPEVPKTPALLPTAVIEGSGSALSVQIVQMDVVLTGDLCTEDKIRADAAQDAGDSIPRKEFGRRAGRLWKDGQHVAERALRIWQSHARIISGQPWLGIELESPIQYGRSHIFDDETGTRLMSFGPEQTLTIRSGQLALSTDQMKAIADAAGEGLDPPIAESLLTDGRFLAQEAEVIDAQRAVLIAAIACEIKTKLTLEHKSPPAKRELVRLLLQRMSNLSDLLDQPMQAALGSSLQKSNPDLYVRMRRLSHLRNQVAHRGVRVDAMEGRQLLVAAGQLFEWLDAL